MKSIKIFAAALALVASVSAFAQENNNRDENGKVVRGPYETNGFWDNWKIGVGGGATFYFDNGAYSKSRIAPAFDVNLEKFFTPSVGARLGYQNISVNSWSDCQNGYAPQYNADKDMYKSKFGFHYLHADLMWNISNAFGGYKETRTWNFIPYLHTGMVVAHQFKSWSGSFDGRDLEFGMGLGLLNDIRLTDRVGLYLDARAILVDEGISGHKHNGGVNGVACVFSTMFGVKFNLGKTNWVRAAAPLAAGYAAYSISEIESLKNKVAALEKENAALKDEVAALKAENAALKDELAKAKAVKGFEAVTPATVYFEIGQTKLSEKELAHLEYYVKNIVDQDKDKKFVLTGCADKQTGTAKRNQQLSEQRVNYVYDLMVNKYGVAADRLEVKAVGSTDNRYSSPVLNRVVIIE